MSALTEKQLLQRVREFDQAALAAVYDEFSPGLYRYAMRLLGNVDLAEECVSETFSRFLRAIKMERGPQRHLKAYLYRIAHNWITDIYRRSAPQELELSENYYVKHDPGLQNEVEERMKKAKVRNALRHLTSDQRQVIILRFYEGWKNEEVASALKRPVGAVKALQHRGLASLRRQLLQNKEIVS